MKITDIKTFNVFTYRTNFVFVKLETDEGISGIGEGTLEYKENALLGAIEDIKRVLIGQDPREVERISHELYRDSYWRVGPVLQSAVSAVNMAMWDIKAKAAGIEINEFYMPGMGGREYARQSALDTADVMNQVNPDFIRIRSMALAENLEMYEDYETGLLTRPNDVETIGEIRLFLENLHGITSWVDSDHILNILLELKGRLPQDKDRMLALIDRFLDLPENQQMLFRLGRRLGLMGQLRDLSNQVLVDKVKQTMDQANIDKTNIDAVCDRLMIRAIPI